MPLLPSLRNQRGVIIKMEKEITKEFVKEVVDKEFVKPVLDSLRKSKKDSNSGKREIKLNLGSGTELLEGFINVDFAGNPEVKHDLNNYPYPFKDNSVDYILASHIIEHLDVPLMFLRECRRILKKGSLILIKTPHVSALGGSFGTFGHKWYFHEGCIKDVTGHIERSTDTSTNEKLFEHVSTKVKRGRFLFWQKREIFWVVRK